MEQQCKQEKLILKFGDIYTLWNVFKQSELGEICASIFPNEQDTLNALLCFKMLVGSAFDNVDAWFGGSYAKLLFPKAALDGRRLSEFLKYLGEEYVQRTVFDLYLSKTVGNESDIIIDSTGLPNEIDMSTSQFGNYGATSEQESRLILVVDQFVVILREKVLRRINSCLMLLMIRFMMMKLKIN